MFNENIFNVLFFKELICEIIRVNFYAKDKYMKTHYLF